MSALARKNNLAKHLSWMQKRKPFAYDFVPQTWILPYDYSEFRAYVEKGGRRDGGKGISNTIRKEAFIVKPEASC